MLASQRHWVARIGLIVLIGTFAAPLGTAIHMAFDGDSACETSGLGPRHATSQFDTARAASTAEHCAVCHWMHVVTDRGPQPVREVAVLLHAEPFTVTAPQAWAGDGAFTPLSPRAPPSRSL